MPKAERPWLVTPHKPIEKLEDNLWVVQSGLPGRSSGSRRMAIARLKNGDLVFYNAVPLEEPAMKQLTDWGRPAFLILPSNLHMMDGHAFAQRLNLKVYGPKRDTKMQARVKVEGGLEDFVSDGTVKVSEVAGSKNGEAVLQVESAGRTSLVFADFFMNIPSEGAGLFSRVVGFTGGPKVPWLMKTMVMTDRAAFKRQLQTWAALPSAHRLIPSHGHIVEGQAAALLGQLAQGL